MSSSPRARSKRLDGDFYGASLFIELSSLFMKYISLVPDLKFPVSFRPQLGFNSGLGHEHRAIWSESSFHLTESRRFSLIAGNWGCRQVRISS